MKYMLLLTRGQWEDSGSEDDRNRTFGQVGEWWGTLAGQGKLGEGHQLQAPSTATTVVIDHGQTQVVDGPFMESKEVVGGYGILDAADLDEAIAIARTFPVPDGKVEIRPLHEHM